MSAFELRPTASHATVPDARQLVWPTTSRDGGTIVCDYDPWLSALAPLPPAAVDLVRISAGAYAADRLTARGRRFTRDIDLRVHVTDFDRWAHDHRPIEAVQALLGRLTGDRWGLELVPDAAAPPAGSGRMVLYGPGTQTADVVALLSGGLDSLCGAVLAPSRQRRLHLGHWNGPAVKHAQNQVREMLPVVTGPGLGYAQVRLTQAGPKAEPSTRSRSLLFLALAAAHAASVGAPVIEVPENGYTSLNPPLTRARAGALSTRSTHPQTLRHASDLFGMLGLGVTVQNPYQSCTKGEMVRAAAARTPLFGALAGVTLSCSKLDGRVYRGGNAQLNCGLCFPCMVRRSSLAAGGVADTTDYLLDTLDEYQRRRLVWRRRSDIADLGVALRRGLTDSSIVGPFPPGFDRCDATGVCERALDELRQVPLPVPSDPGEPPAGYDGVDTSDGDDPTPLFPLEVTP